MQSAAERPAAQADRSFYLSLGPLLAIGLGLALVPLRGLTNASNFTFAFLAWVIVVAEYGGRAAGLATAVASALSLDFFLTEPYMQLTIADKHDVIAFCGLAACGLVAAALGSRRKQQLTALGPAQRGVALLRGALHSLSTDGPREPRLEALLQQHAEALPVAALALRDEKDFVLALSARGAGLRSVPERMLQPDTLLWGAGPGSASPQLALPEQGGRLALECDGRRVGWLDVWGDGAAADAESRRQLSDLARLSALFLAAEQARPR